MLQWFISFPEFDEFTEILFYSGKTQMDSLKLPSPISEQVTQLHVRKLLPFKGDCCYVENSFWFHLNMRIFSMWQFVRDVFRGNLQRL